MTALIFKLVGGIGLFLMGMVLMTDGLKAFAGDSLRRALVRFTGTPWKAFGSGTLVTALVQSSSATTVTVIGFVSAGLLSFPQAVGVVMGASLGTTSTGWVVAGLGLKVSVGFYALPLVGIGAFMRLLARGRWRSFGMALAGFGLIFIGIETLQEAMRGLSGVLNLSALPAGGLVGHLLAMILGIVLTVVMQSSSAAVATTLTALHTGTISFEQAASLVIGAAIGTTVTGALAAIGGSVPAKRTALAHVSFNLATGIIAVGLLPLFLRGIVWAQHHLGLDPGAMSLAAFHTSFIAVGVLIFLPFATRFAGLIERALPDEGPELTRHLDDTLLQTPAVALEATRRALAGTAGQVLDSLHATLGDPRKEPDEAGIEELRRALEQIQQFFARVPGYGDHEPLSQIRVSQMHAIDHLARLHKRLNPPASLRHVFDDPRLLPALKLGREILALGSAGLGGRETPDWRTRLDTMADELAELRRQQRPTILEGTAAGAASPAHTLELLDAIRWLDVVAYHTRRLANYLGDNGSAPAAPPTAHEPNDADEEN
ncbi:MAG: Na/Pi cotransporter family protein [Candidatus Sumerlaeia bacterium]|nr:Na/Pi cotransporter family protein [Candidatus Sumerlaeia bacterium]